MKVTRLRESQVLNNEEMKISKALCPRNNEMGCNRDILSLTQNVLTAQVLKVGSRSPNLRASDVGTTLEVSFHHKLNISHQ